MKQTVTTRIIYQGRFDDKDWPHFLWSVHIGQEVFSYMTGMGHKTNAVNYDKKPKSLTRKVLREDDYFVHIPKVRDVLHCLFMDADAGEMSQQDFCDNFGYDFDSIKALNSYRSCSETSMQLRRIFGSKYSDYKARVLSWNI